MYASFSTMEVPLIRKQVRFSSTAVAIGLVIGVLTLSACGGGSSSSSDGNNTVAGLEQPTEGAANQNLTIGDDMALPADWPKEVPAFTSGSLNTVGVNPDGSADASWTTSATAADVAKEYETALAAAGYTIVAGSEITGVEDISGADYSGSGYSINMLVSTTDGETTLFVTAIKG